MFQTRAGGRVLLIALEFYSSRVTVATLLEVPDFAELSPVVAIPISPPWRVMGAIYYISSLST